MMSVRNTKKNLRPAVEELLSRGVERAIDETHLRQTLLSGKKLRVKFGIDPTAPDLHLGHAVALKKLRAFQDLGHKAVLIIGDFTAQIGDPSGRTEGRKPLAPKTIAANMKHYLAQAGKIINIKQAEVRRNSEWYKKEGIEIMLELTKSTTVQQMLAREDFSRRIKEGSDVSMLEAFYPLFQGYDSVVVKADVELGGADQLLNLLVGRKLQRHFKVPEQDIITVPLLEGTDGAKKMSKSADNYIAFEDAPEEMFGKTMSIPDGLIQKYFTLLTDIERGELRAILQLPNPRNQKIILAETIVTQFHNKFAAQKARTHFEALFSKKEVPNDIDTLRVTKKISVLDLAMKSGVPKSKSEARRLIEQGAASLDDQPLKDPHETITPRKGAVLRVGKKSFFRIGD